MQVDNVHKSPFLFCFCSCIYIFLLFWCRFSEPISAAQPAKLLPYHAPVQPNPSYQQHQGMLHVNQAELFETFSVSLILSFEYDPWIVTKLSAHVSSVSLLSPTTLHAQLPNAFHRKPASIATNGSADELADFHWYLTWIQVIGADES